MLDEIEFLVTHWDAEGRTVEQVAFEAYGLVHSTGCVVEFMVMGWDYTSPHSKYTLRFHRNCSLGLTLRQLWALD
ncbi:hypothetical protein ACFX2I_007938 [Malus domestica]|uniref:Uncharacterized protein n=1 Tax=Malus domestica TaxID=3750 RepID=A0A498IPU4_MALDO|nr:hypothetical protein DVH24_027044 [Malus domestica]